MMLTEKAWTHRDFFDLIVESRSWSERQLKDYQQQQLAALLAHARRSVPFYSERLDVVLLRGGDIDWDRWDEIPIVTRKDLHRSASMLLSLDVPEGHGPTGSITSSGSTGDPVTVTFTAMAGRFWQSLRWSMMEQHGFDWSAWFLNRVGSVEGPDDWPHGTPRGPWGPPWEEASGRGFMWSINLRAPTGAVLDFLDRRPCRYLISGPKTAHLLALEARRTGRALALEKIAIQSGRLGDDDRAICEQVFGAQVIDIYSSKEGGQMAYRCPHGRMHVNAQGLFVEIIREDGSRADPGEVGRVVITPFFSTAQPLIRYDQGDYAALGGVCTCGSQHPVLSDIVGRTLAVFYHPDGRTTLGILPNSARDLLNCEFWQIAQVGPLDFEVRYVERDTPAPRDEAAFTTVFRSTYFADSRVSFRRLDSMPLTRAGKLNEYVREWTPLGGLNGGPA